MEQLFDAAEQELYKLAAQMIKDADAVLVTAGAGMSVDCGIPDFRGPNGFWSNFSELQERIDTSRFKTDPQDCWGFYSMLYESVTKAEPHDGYHMLWRWLKDKSHFVITSNVDGMFQRAGFSNVFEIHGTMHLLQELSPVSKIYEAKDFDIRSDGENLISPVPTKDGKTLRPNVLMFGDMDWCANPSADQEEECFKWKLETLRKKSVVIEIGAGSALPTIKHMTDRYAVHHKAPLIRINLDPKDAQDATISLTGTALGVLRKMDSLF